MLIALPFRTSRSEGAVLVYPRSNSPFTQDEKTLASALVGFGAVAIANAELHGTARMEQANRHWMEVFDAISDFIVVHDQQHQILRVNRSLADLVGIAPDG